MEIPRLPIVRLLESVTDGRDAAELICMRVEAAQIAATRIPDLLHGASGGVIAVCTSGSLELEMDRGTVRLAARDMYSFAAGSLVRIREASADFAGWVLFVPSHYIADVDSHLSAVYFLSSFSNPLVHFTPADLDTFCSLLNAIGRHVSQPSRPFRGKVINLLLTSLGFELCYVYDGQARVSQREHLREEELLRAFLRLVEENCRQHRGLKFYAERLAITPKHLSLSIKRISGHSGAEWIDYVLIIHLKKTLRTSPLTIQQVADLYNFPNNSFFGKYFKKHTGMTPREFKMQG